MWEHLDVPTTDAGDCRRILEALSKEKADEIATEVLVLRHLISLADQRGLKRKLQGVPVRTYSGWSTGTDTVYAIRNRSLAEEVGSQWPVWRLPIGLDEALPLVGVLGVTVLADEAFRPDVPSDAIAANDLQPEFPAVITHLRNYLVLHHPELHGRLTPDQWQELAEATVALGAGWGVKVRADGRRALRIQPKAHLFRDPLLFCALDMEEAGQHDAGGNAVASFLLGEDAREEDRAFIALAWESAFRRRREGEEAIEVEAPTSEEPTDGGAIPAWLRSRSAKRRSGKPKVRKTRRQEKEPPRELIDPDELDFSTIKATVAGGTRVGKFRYPPKKKLAAPKPASAVGSSTRRAGSKRAGDRSYTATDREDLGFALVQTYLREVADLELEDIRDQDNVGADGLDEGKDVWVELKAFGRDRDDTVRLERPEAIRAKEKGDRYLLVLVWNLEKPRRPEILVVADPLARLDVFLGNGIKLVGLDEVVEDTTS